MEALPPGFRWPDGYRAAAMFTFDVDAEAVMLTDHPEVIDYLDVIGHQRYGPQVAVPRLLRMLDRRQLRTTFFVPGWVAETWPDVIRSIRDAGHEIGHHGYMHESVRGKDVATEEGYLTRGLEALDTVAGVRPVGYRPPSCDMNFRTPDLVARHGFTYSSGMMDSDHPYRWASGLIELPMHWSLDDWNRYNYVPGYASSPILRPSDVVDAWAEELFFIRNATGGVSSPFSDWLVLRGLKTLAVRMERHCRAAHDIAQFLLDHPKVREVRWPGLATHPGYEVAHRQMLDFGGMVSFVVAGGAADAAEVVARTRLFTLAESLGAVESLIEQPAVMTHLSVAGSPLDVDPALIRLSVGLETIDDLIADLDRALAG